MDVLVHVSMHVVFSTMSMYVVKTIEDRLRAAALTRNPKILVYFLKNIYHVKHIPHSVHVCSTDSGIAKGPTSDKAIMARIRVYVCASACMWYLQNAYLYIK